MNYITTDEISVIFDYLIGYLDSVHLALTCRKYLFLLQTKKIKKYHRYKILFMERALYPEYREIEPIYDIYHRNTYIGRYYTFEYDIVYCDLYIPYLSIPPGIYRFLKSSLTDLLNMYQIVVDLKFIYGSKIIVASDIELTYTRHSLYPAKKTVITWPRFGHTIHNKLLDDFKIAYSFVKCMRDNLVDLLEKID